MHLKSKQGSAGEPPITTGNEHAYLIITNIIIIHH